MSTRQKLVLFSSPDGTGKTEISRGLSTRLDVPYFKFSGEAWHWKKNSFKDVLTYGEPRFVELIKQTKMNVVMDRGYACEWVYSQVFKRETDMLTLDEIDLEFAKMGTYIVIPLRHDYENSRADDLVPPDKLWDLHQKYLEFANWTRCTTIVMYVDTFKEDLEKELNALESCLDWSRPTNEKINFNLQDNT